MTASRKEMHSSYADFSDDSDPATVTEAVANSLKETLTRIQLPQLSSQEQFHLADIIECVGMVEKHRRSIDDNAGRFLLFFRQHVLRSGQHSAEQVPISWREIVWAFHSGSQDILVDLVSRHFNGRMLWRHARESGIFMWMTDLTALVRPPFPHPPLPLLLHPAHLPYLSAPNSSPLPATNIRAPTTKTPSTAASSTSPSAKKPFSSASGA
jgi:hypothetical protein